MALNVKFLKGTAAGFEALVEKDLNTFYLVTGTDAEGLATQDLYLGNVKLSNQPEITAALASLGESNKKIENLEKAVGDITGLSTEAKTNLVAAINELVTKVNANTSAIGKVEELTTTTKANLVAAVNELDTLAKANASAIGKVADLTTDAKTNVVAAVNEVVTKVANAETAGKVSVKALDSNDYSKVYKIYQGETKEDDADFGLVGTINIPKDMVVQSGTVEVNPAGQEPGTYLVLTLANATNDKIYINAASLVDIYTAKAGATEVQLTVSETGEISAALVDGGVATAKLADGAVTTVKIADDAVTTAKIVNEAITTDKIANGAIVKDKLDENLKKAVENANSAVQKVEAGSADGSIKVDGTDVAVTGLKSAAFAETTAFDTAGSASTAETNAKKHATDLNTAMDTRMQKVEAAVGEGGSVDTQINTAIGNLDADVTSAEVEAGKGIQVQVVEEDGKVKTVAVTGNFDNAYEAKGAAATVKTEAATDATTKANAAEKNAKDYVDNALTWGSF